MPQTLLALCSIMAFAYFALGRQQHDADVERRALAAEVDLAALDVAKAKVTELERLPFDEDAVGAGPIRVSPSSAPLGPEPDETGPLLFDDVDDWDGAVETETVAVGGGALRFRVAVEVGYVRNDEPSEPSATSTMTKDVAVTVTELDAPLDRVPATATLRRVVTPVGSSTIRR